MVDGSIKARVHFLSCRFVVARHTSPYHLPNGESPSGQFDRHHSLSKEAIYNIYLGSVSSVRLYNQMLDSGKIFCPLLLSTQPVFWDRASNLQMDRPVFFTHQARSGDRGIVRHLTELSPENVTCTRAHSTMRTILEPNLRSV